MVFRNACPNYQGDKIVTAESLLQSVLELPASEQYAIAAAILEKVDGSAGLPFALYNPICHLSWRWNVELVVFRGGRGPDRAREVLLFPIPDNHAFYPAGELHVPGTFPAGTQDFDLGEILRRTLKKYGLPAQLFSRHQWPEFRKSWPNPETKPGPTLHQIYRMILPEGADFDIPAGARWVSVASGTSSYPILAFHRTIIGLALGEYRH